MMEIILTIGVFSSSFVLHVLIHRLLMKYGIHTFASVAVFFPGFFLLVAIFFRMSSPFLFPLSSLLLYALLFVFHMISFFSASNGDQSSGRILFFIRDAKRARYQDIRQIFTNEELVKKRLNDLMKGKFVTVEHNRLKLLPKGRLIHSLFSRYRTLLRWDAGG